MIDYTKNSSNFPNKFSAAQIQEMLQKGLMNKNRPRGYVSAIAQAPIKPNFNSPIDLTGESNDNSNGIRGRPFRKRKRGSDSDESSDEESTRLLKVVFIIFHNHESWKRNLIIW